MKKTSLSLAALLALTANANAQSLEEAIRGVEVNGFLRYEYEDNRFKNQGFDKNGEKSGDVEHTWHAEAEFSTPVQDYVSLNLGIYYEVGQNTNHGKGIEDDNGDIIPFLGYGLGSGKDGSFGVSTFNALITPDSTSTNVTLGKMRLDTPFNDNGEDRGTGILAVNSDIPYLTLVAGAFDSWALDDIKDEPVEETSITKPLYLLAGLASFETDYGNVEGQLWWFHIDDIVDSAFFGELGFFHEIFHINGQYAYSQGNSSGIANLAVALTGDPTLYGRYQTKSDFLSLEVGADLESLEIPLSLNLGYIGNTQDNFAVSLDDEGALQLAGAVWFDNVDATGVSFSTILGATNGNIEKDLDVFYASLAYNVLDNFSIGIDYINGKNKVKDITARTTTDIDFYEITPNITWEYSKNLEIGAYYAFLRTERSGHYTTPETDSEDRNQFKVEIVYSF
ncbi:major outer membrane protein [Helicobacter sp. MIT 05-5294]|uniref:major outer membrane protein n=1 Tax=Helicobacter sp. MIT 05-5294 TaxID=1548150 RepID=UPI00051F8D59|nr:major outer membrane protein [Helicobacter sp. MIT 05-5294]TLD87543.1 major outer membrane protein [Helicobacter sp. MIT 05-5294]